MFDYSKAVHVEAAEINDQERTLIKQEASWLQAVNTYDLSTSINAITMV